MSTADVIKNENSLGPLARLRYPLDVEEGQHFMQFLPRKYVYSNKSSGFIAIEASSGSITLPLPKGLSDSQSVRWGAESVGAIGESIAAANSVQDFLKTSNVSEIGIQAILKTLESRAHPFQGLKEGAYLKAGVAFNPFLAMTFEGVNFKNYNFNFEFFAKSKEESEQVKKIIDRFRYNMLPSYNEHTRVLFNYPNIFHISFMDSEYLFRFKPCILQDMVVNYHGQGDAFYFDLNGKKIPASVNLSLSFSEIEIVTKNDYSDENTPKTNFTDIPEHI
jgi:hypothetical protein